MKKIDLTGQKFGQLVVTEEVKRRKQKKIYWKCICDCGRNSIVMGGHLKSGATKSCGCLVKTHNLSKSLIYNTWDKMIRRCTDLNDKSFKDYGGRGITVCEEWLNIENFYVDMGERPKGLTIERIDNNKGYYKENCKWASQIEQKRNQRLRKDNRTGIRGVNWSKQHQKYQVRISVNYKTIWLGCFTSIEDAKAARKKAELEYWVD